LIGAAHVSNGLCLTGTNRQLPFTVQSGQGRWMNGQCSALMVRRWGNWRNN